MAAVQMVCVKEELRDNADCVEEMAEETEVDSLTYTVPVKEEEVEVQLQSENVVLVTEDRDAAMRSRLVDSLCSSFPGSALSRALHMLDADAEADRVDPLSQSCFSQLRLGKALSDSDEEDSCSDADDADDELTSLAWLQDSNLLKNINPADRSLCTSPTSDEGSGSGSSQKENINFFDDTSDDAVGGGGYGRPHPPNVPYDPQKHVNSKPPYSFSCLIFMAIEDSPHKRLPVKEIYNWIVANYPYFQNAPTGWKNSVRHNLSLNKCFRKVDKDRGGVGCKGAMWMIDPDYRPNLLQALRKTPYHPFHQLQMLACPQQSYSAFSSIQKPGVYSSTQQNIPPRLFPYVSRRIAHSKFDTDVDVANALVFMKHTAETRRPPLRSVNGRRQNGARSPSPPEFGSEEDRKRLQRKRKRVDSPVICTSSPSDDHTYSITMETLERDVGSPGSSIDDEYEFGEAGGYSRSDDDEATDDDFGDDDDGDYDRTKKVVASGGRQLQRREAVTGDGDATDDEFIAQGADALMHLVRMKLSKRPTTPTRTGSPDSGAGQDSSRNTSPTKADSATAFDDGIDTVYHTST